MSCHENRIRVVCGSEQKLHINPQQNFEGGRSHFASVDGLTSLPLCKVLQVLRKNGDSIVAVLEAFVHDPLIDWFAKRKKGGKNQRSWIKEREKKKQSRCLYICWLV